MTPQTIVRRAAFTTALALAAAATGLPVAGAAERGPLRATIASASTSGGESSSRARVIVKYKSDGALMRGLSAGERQSPRQAAQMAQRLSATLTDGRVVAPRTQVLHGHGLSSQALLAKLANDPDVEYAEIDQRVTIQAAPNDALYAASSAISPVVGQWYLRAPDSTAVSAINAEGAWLTSTGSATVTVAVVDTGVRFDHPDLAAKLWPGYDFISADSDGSFATAGDSSGRDADASDPGDWVTAGECGTGEAASDSSWHGTQVSGLIGASTDNGLGMASVGRNVMILPVRALGKCGGYQSDIVAGMRWAAGLSSNPTVNPHPARVVNLSLGSSGTCSTTYQSAITELTAAGIVVVVAAGNSAGLAANQPSNCTGALGVAGVRHIGTKVGYSNVGPQLSIAAPAGNCVNTSGDCLYPLLTTINLGTTTPGVNSYSDASNYSVGTSFATPLVSGTIALMLSVNPSLTPAQIKTMLQSTARAFPTLGADAGVSVCHAPNGSAQDECYCSTTTCGAGMLDTSAALAAAAGTAAAPVAVIAAATTRPVVGSSTALSATSSSRTASTYHWSITQGASSAQLIGATSASTATLSPLAPGAVIVSLTVTDSAGQSSTTSKSLTVIPTPPPTVSVAASKTGPEVGTRVTLSATAEAYGGRSITKYEWSFLSGDTLATLAANNQTASTYVDIIAAGPMQLQVKVTDSGGDTATAVVSLTAVAATTPTDTDSDSGGGAMSAAWLALLAAAVAALAALRSSRRA